MDKGEIVMDNFIEIAKIVTPVILTGIITFLITRYTYRINIPLDKLEKAYNKVYYPIYCLFYTDKSTEYIIKKCKQYLEKYKKYVDKSTLMAFEILMKSYTDLEYDKSSYESFKINIFNMNSRLRKRLGYLVPNILDMYHYNTPARRYGLRMLLYMLFSLIGCYIFALLPCDWKVTAMLVILLVFFVISLSESIVILFRIVVWRELKKWYIKHKRGRNVS